MPGVRTFDHGLALSGDHPAQPHGRSMLDPAAAAPFAHEDAREEPSAPSPMAALAAAIDEVLGPLEEAAGGEVVSIDAEPTGTVEK